jgi:ligand-binding sensor domain-containing protein/serine phosphatase RsbU (regulator of sigma subunit)
LNILKKTFFYIVFWSALCPLSAQQLRFKHITSEDGLSTNYITCMMQDDLGFMWFGSQDGLNKYEGVEHKMKIFKHDPINKSSLFNSEVTALLQVRKDLMLVGTREGLDFFSPLTEKFFHLPLTNNNKAERVNVIFKLDNSTALIGTDDGLFTVNFNNSEVKRFLFKGFRTIAVKAIQISNGNILVGTLENGLWRLSNNELEKIALKIPQSFRINQQEISSITYILPYHNYLFLGTEGNGLFKINAKNFSVEKNINFNTASEASNIIKSFVIKDDKILAATRFGVITHHLISNETNTYTKEEGSFALNSNECTCIFVDSESNCWVGTNLGGVNVSFFQSLKFPNSTKKIETLFDNVYAFYEENKDALLLGSVKALHGLNLQSGQVSNYDRLNGTVLSIEKENDNTIWFGTWGAGLFRYDKTTGKTKRFFDKSFGGTIVCLKVYDGSIYAGSVGDGLFKIDLKTYSVTSYGLKEGLSNTSVNCIFVDSKQRVWIGTYDGGLIKMDGFPKTNKLPVKKIYTNSGKATELASNIVFSINEDKNGKIWVATSAGLSKMISDTTFYNFYERDGLANTFLYAILKDSLNNFWMSSNNGIIRFNPLSAEKDMVFKNYSNKDGLVNVEHNMGAAFTSTSGLMYFGGTMGFNVFRPTSIKDNMHAPNAYVIGYTRGGNNVVTDTVITYKKHLQLSYSENFFQFEVVALDYTDPSKNKFKYKLEGYDNDWSPATSARNIEYKKLEGGHYTFKLKASNNDGVWNEMPYEITIEVVPPFWKTKWFIFLVILSGVGAIVAYFQYRTRAFKAENKRLEQKVAERTRELEEKNIDITSSITYARRIQEAILPSKDLIFKKLTKVFILYQPKDIVSGDFYWFAEKDGVKIFAVVDCTGHGVPGAFMSMIGHNLLHRIVNEKAIVDPAEILNNLHKGVQEALRQGQNEINTNDGMDVSMITINQVNKEVKWAGANRPLVLIDAQGNFNKLDGNKFPVGGAQLNSERVFTTNVVNLGTATMAYMFSDGYADQFGGEKGKKFMVKRFHDLLQTIHLLPADEQRRLLQENFDAWRSNHEQVDDVLVVGLEI